MACESALRHAAHAGGDALDDDAVQRLDELRIEQFGFAAKHVTLIAVQDHV